MCLVDTGSAVTLVHFRLWKQGRAAKRGESLQPHLGGPVVTANGEPLTILGQSSSRIQIAGTEFTHTVLVTADIGQDCLLGADFLVAHGFVINMGA